jgi:branched-chain amino acid transport system ATP-binding protein
LLDEVAGGLTDHEAHEIVAMVRTIGERGIAVIWIEHVVHALLAVATRLLVLSNGRELAVGDPRNVIASAEVRRVYMGIEA